MTPDRVLAEIERDLHTANLLWVIVHHPEWLEASR